MAKKSKERATFIRDALPPEGLFAGKNWRISPDPIQISRKLFQQIVELGPRLHRFYQACNLLYRQSVEGKQPSWIHTYLDQGKPAQMIELARERRWKNDLPIIIRPDLLLTDKGLALTELDSVPGGIGLTAWFQKTLGHLPLANSSLPAKSLLENFGNSMIQGIELSQVSSFHVVVVVSDEAQDYRPEMTWLVAELKEIFPHPIQWSMAHPSELEYHESEVFLHGNRVDRIYRFFEHFDFPNISNIESLIASAQRGYVTLTPPLKPQLEEKMWLALFWFPQLAEFWRKELGDRYFRDLREIIPMTWLLDPAPIPPHGGIQSLPIHDWRELERFSQKQRDFVIKISGFSELAWGSRGVFMGSDLSSGQWIQQLREALANFTAHPSILQREAHTQLIEHSWYDFESNQLVPMKGRLRLCPYYTVEEGEVVFSGTLATLCLPDKKIIHGMSDAILTLAVPE